MAAMRASLYAPSGIKRTTSNLYRSKFFSLMSLNTSKEVIRYHKRPNTEQAIRVPRADRSVASWSRRITSQAQVELILWTAWRVP
jgi:hypothetical protein